MADAIGQGTCEKLLHHFQPKAGDCLFIPAGTVHALGAGLLVAEVQQSSDTTFRLYDWNRVGPDGKPRPLHVEQGLAVVDFQRGPVDPVQPQPTDRPWVSRLVACDKFIMDRWDFDQPQTIGGDDRFHIVCVLQGAVRIERRPAERTLVQGWNRAFARQPRQRPARAAAAHGAAGCVFGVAGWSRGLRQLW